MKIKILLIHELLITMGAFMIIDSLVLLQMIVHSILMFR
jgi:hypothetical protein